jgi:uncharacterized protein (TIGR00296 family)
MRIKRAQIRYMIIKFKRSRDQTITEERMRDQKAKLLRLARETIRTRLSGKNAASPDMKGEFSEEIFSEKCGAFVTLHISGRLRGCIGYIVGQKNIPETVLDMSQASAFRDPRFSPLSSGEFKNIDIEISVLSPIDNHARSQVGPPASAGRDRTGMEPGPVSGKHMLQGRTAGRRVEVERHSN